jgi:hypothetical protein
MPGLKGKFVRREGTMVYFGSQKSGEWRPIELTGAVAPESLIPGEYYELETSQNRLLSAVRLTRSAPAPTPAAQSSRGGDSGASPGAVQQSSLMASATGVVKSCIEKGISPATAMAEGLRWAAMWGDVPRLPPLITVDLDRDEDEAPAPPKDPGW